jgi:hypothetical protein
MSHFSSKIEIRVGMVAPVVRNRECTRLRTVFADPFIRCGRWQSVAPVDEETAGAAEPVLPHRDDLDSDLAFAPVEAGQAKAVAAVETCILVEI